jgi:hypothetical protein
MNTLSLPVGGRRRTRKLHNIQFLVHQLDLLQKPGREVMLP